MLSGKNALITGASRGIGRAIAIKFAENGAFVGINYNRSEDKAKEVLKIVKSKGGEGILLKGDVSSPKDCKKIVDDFVGERESIDVLVLNAGIYERGGFLEIDEKRWERVISTNLSSCYYILKFAIPHMKEGGSIIFISSQLAFKGSRHGADYAASKAGMLGLMRSLALELAPKIRVNAVAPGTIDTDIISGYTQEMREKRISEIPLRRLGKPEDVANVCLFLASDLSSYITGEVINVNGGLYIH
ncbi:MAG: SDR family NAD(P)-dependent oxidoreductase [Thermoplasmata archaeon]|mgnify:CR=1 FL=1|nr:MAG: SDR family NAD(P)-dependent oxidoreductase [Thermoplasmata archaeon]